MAGTLVLVWPGAGKSGIRRSALRMVGVGMVGGGQNAAAGQQTPSILLFISFMQVT
ncbi:hypothetical protein AB0869_30850 [Micromonospora vinacea]|uniref:hypothetical protein n=1 Tax=Micromonospora vinacea TaxID=709878 RepID=UPI003451232F